MKPDWNDVADQIEHLSDLAEGILDELTNLAALLNEIRK